MRTEGAQDGSDVAPLGEVGIGLAGRPAGWGVICDQSKSERVSHLRPPVSLLAWASRRLSICCDPMASFYNAWYHGQR